MFLKWLHIGTACTKEKEYLMQALKNNEQVLKDTEEQLEHYKVFYSQSSGEINELRRRKDMAWEAYDGIVIKNRDLEFERDSLKGTKEFLEKKLKALTKKS